MLEQCGNNLTRENLMKRAASVHDLKLPMLLPGITVSTSADDFAPIKQMQLEKFDGNAWQLFGEVVSGPGARTFLVAQRCGHPTGGRRGRQEN